MRLRKIFNDTGLQIFSIWVVAVVLSTSAAHAEHSERNSSQRILVIGTLLTDEIKSTARLQPMASYVKTHMADFGVDDVIIVTANNRDQLAQLVRHGRVDWVSQTANNLVYFIRYAHMEVLARGWRNGAPTFSSVFFVRKESEIADLNGLSNRVVALEHPFAENAYSVPILELQSSGRQTYMLSSARDHVPSNQVGYLVSSSDYNTALWVHKGIVDAGVLSRTRWNNSDVVPDQFRDNLRVIHETQEFVTALELVRADLDADLKDGLQKLLFKMHEDPDATPLLRSYFNTQRFDQPTTADMERIDLLTVDNSVEAHIRDFGR